jgi:hypothetical protein
MPDSLGERFVDALARKDVPGLKALLRKDVDFRGMTPRAFWEASDADAVVDDILLGKWFEEQDVIKEVLAVETSTVAKRHRVTYRFRIAGGDGDYLAEQQAYLDADGDQIGWLRIMCSGFVRDPDQDVPQLKTRGDALPR